MINEEEIMTHSGEPERPNLWMSGGELIGPSGGRVEFVGMKIEWLRQEDGTFEPTAVLKLTDHDQLWKDENERYYYLELPINRD